MKKINIKYLILPVALILFISSGCKKVLDPTPFGAQTIDATFNDFNGTIGAVNGIYAQFTNSNLYRGTSGLLAIDQASDDVMDNAISQSGYSPVDYFELAANNGITYNIMDDFYRAILRSNIVIGRVPAINFPLAFQKNGTGLLFKDQFTGEALFFRAFSYYNLVRIFGDVPLRINEISAATQVNIPRSPAAEVYKQIEQDLIEAAQKLPLTYTGSGSGNERGRVSKMSALVVLSEVYLTQKKYAEAKTTALQVIQNAGGYRLNNTYISNFPARNGGTENTQESLFEIQFSAVGIAANATAPQGHGLSYLMGPTTDGVGIPFLANYRPTDNNAPDNEAGFTGGLVQEFLVGDLRIATNFLQGLRGNGVIGWLTNKYYEVGRGSSCGGNFVAYRVADAYLIYAEATNELGAPDVQSIDYVNQLRRRAFGLPLTTVSVQDIDPVQTQAAFRNILRSERRKELAMENKRWFDLVRYGFNYANDILKVNQKRVNFNQTKLLFPFPEVELVNNPLLTQNPGY